MPFIDVPGYGRFDPGLPAWLELGPDGKLHNKNATDPSKPWYPPPGFTGGVSWCFTPESQIPPPEPPPAPPVEPPPPPEPPAPPVEPPPEPPPVDVPPVPVPVLAPAVAATLAHQRAALALAEASLEQDRKYIDAQAALLAAARKLVDDFEAGLKAAAGR